MNIKKIIREEIGDLGWMEDVEPTFKNTDFKFNGKNIGWTYQHYILMKEMRYYYI